MHRCVYARAHWSNGRIVQKCLNDVEEFLELRDNTGDEARRAYNLNLAHWIPEQAALTDSGRAG